jgi:hypothetical protein
MEYAEQYSEGSDAYVDPLMQRRQEICNTALGRIMVATMPIKIGLKRAELLGIPSKAVHKVDRDMDPSVEKIYLKVFGMTGTDKGVLYSASATDEDGTILLDEDVIIPEMELWNLLEKADGVARDKRY